MDMQATTEGEALQADSDEHDPQGDLHGPWLYDAADVTDFGPAAITIVDRGDPPGIVDPRAEFIRQLGELARQYDNVRVAHVFFEGGAHGALIRIGDDLTWADAGSHWGGKQL